MEVEEGGVPWIHRKKEELKVKQVMIFLLFNLKVALTTKHY